MADDTGSGTGGRWLRIALFVSLALNLAVAGLFIGHALDGDRGKRGYRGGPDESSLPYTRALNDEQRRALGRSLRRDIEKRRGNPTTVLADYRAAVEVLRAEPFDPAAMGALLEAQSKRADARKEAGKVVLTEFLSGLSPQERQAYADRLEAQIARIEAWQQRSGRN